MGEIVGGKKVGVGVVVKWLNGNRVSFFQGSGACGLSRFVGCGL